MSLATKTALVARLEGNATLQEVLARDPEAPDRVALFLDSRAGLEHRFGGRVAYPCITYRITSLVIDNRFRPVPAEGGGPGPIRAEIATFEVWGQGRDDEPVERAFEALVAELDGAEFSLADGGNLFRAELQASTPDLFDPARNAYFATLTFTLRYCTGDH